MTDETNTNGDDTTNGNAGDSGAGQGDGTTGTTPAGSNADGSGGQDGMTDKERELLKESMSRKEKIKQLEQKLNEASGALKAWEGLNPEDVRKLVQEKRDAELKTMERKGEWDKIRQQMLEAHGLEKKSLSDQIKALEDKLGTYSSQIDQLTVGSAFSTSKFIADELVLTPSKARTVYGSHFERDAEGRVVGYDKPAGVAGRAPLVDGQGNALPFDAALKKLVEVDPDRDALLKAKVKPGADSGTTNAKSAGGESKGSDAGVTRIAEALRNGGLKTFKRA